MKNALFLSLLVGCLLITLSCNRDPLPAPNDSIHNINSPELTLTVKKVRVTKAELSGELVKVGNLKILSQGFVWDINQTPTVFLSSKIEFSGLVSNRFDTTLIGLQQDAMYYSRAYIITAKDTIYSSSQVIKTLPQWEVFDNYPADPVGGPVAFKIDSTLFSGTGIWNHHDFFAFDPMLNKWSPREPYPGNSTWGSFGFSIGGLGYIGLGNCNCTLTKEFWQYTPNQNKWEQIADFEGEVREAGVSFVIGKKGYVGIGFNINGALSDIWAYDTELKEWDSIGNFQDGARAYSISFVIDSIAYIGFGRNSQNIVQDDLWKFNPESGDWEEMDSNFPRLIAFSFSLNGKGYVGGGVGRKDFYKFDPSKAPGQQQWEKLEDLPTTIDVAGATAVAFSDFAIIIGGGDGTDLTRRVWKFNSDD